MLPRRADRDFGATARWIAIASTFVILVVVVFGLSNLTERSANLSEASVKNAIRSSVMQCYALEGAYPPSLEYMEENYGLLLDRERYVYLYEVPGSNLLPIVEVQRR